MTGLKLTHAFFPILALAMGAQPAFAADAPRPFGAVGALMFPDELDVVENASGARLVNRSALLGNGFKDMALSAGAAVEARKTLAVAASAHAMVAIDDDLVGGVAIPFLRVAPADLEFVVRNDEGHGGRRSKALLAIRSRRTGATIGAVCKGCDERALSLRTDIYRAFLAQAGSAEAEIYLSAPQGQEISLRPGVEPSFDPHRAMLHVLWSGQSDVPVGIRVYQLREKSCALGAHTVEMNEGSSAADWLSRGSSLFLPAELNPRSLSARAVSLETVRIDGRTSEGIGQLGVANRNEATVAVATLLKTLARARALGRMVSARIDPALPRLAQTLLRVSERPLNAQDSCEPGS